MDPAEAMLTAAQERMRAMGASEGTHAARNPPPESGAPFVLVDLCIDLAAPDAAIALERYREFALESGAELEQVETTCERLVNELKLVSAARDEALLGSAGFCQMELSSAGLSWRGWRAVA